MTVRNGEVVEAPAATPLAPTVWVARHRRTGRPHYIAGEFVDGEYRREMTRHERLPGKPEGELRGSFTRCVSHGSEQAARRRARDLYGYSRVANATENLGEEYEVMA